MMPLSSAPTREKDHALTVDRTVPLQAAAEEAREDARALATQLQTEEGLRASLASQLEVRTLRVTTSGLLLSVRLGHGPWRGSTPISCPVHRALTTAQGWLRPGCRRRRPRRHPWPRSWPPRRRTASSAQRAWLCATRSQRYSTHAPEMLVRTPQSLCKRCAAISIASRRISDQRFPMRRTNHPITRVHARISR